MMKKIVVISMVCLAALSLAQAAPNLESRVSDALKDYIIGKYPQYSRDDIKISFKYAENAFDKLEKMSGGFKIEVIEGYPEFKPLGSVVFPLKVSDGEEIEKLFLRAKVEVMKNVVAAAKYIKKGTIIAEDDLKIELRDIALLPEKYFADAGPIIGKEAKLSIPSNSTLFSWMVGEQPVVRRGATITIVVSAPGLTVKSKGEAQEDGYLNDEIKVKRMDSKKVVLAKIISPAEVEVKIE